MHVSEVGVVERRGWLDVALTLLLLAALEEVWDWMVEEGRGDGALMGPWRDFRMWYRVRSRTSGNCTRMVFLEAYCP